MVAVANPCSWLKFFARLGWLFVICIAIPFLLPLFLIHQLYMCLRYGLSSRWPGENENPWYV